MVSATPPVGSFDAALPRRDLIAICAFLNRKQEGARSSVALFEHAEGVLRQLAAAARMQ